VAGFAEAWVTVKTLADARTKDTFIVTSANDNACLAVGTFLEHGFTPRMGFEIQMLGVRQ
jgi:hypothetical protein